MHREPAVRDSSFNRRAIFLVAATGTDELCVDHGDRQLPGIIGLHRIRQLKQFLLGGVRRRERSLFLDVHLGCMIAMPMASAGRRSPLRPRGMSCPPDDDFRVLDDLYAVRSTGESDDGCLLLFDPKNARRIFYVHINRLLVHIDAFDPVHIGLLLSAKHTTLAEGGDSSTAPCTGIAIESDARVCYMVLLHLVTAVAGFLGTIIRNGIINRWRTFYGSSAVLKSPRDCTMLGSSMRRVGLIDITVGNATRLNASQRSSTRRCASHHIATQRLSRWGSPAARARLARTGPLKRLWLRDGHAKRNIYERNEFSASRRPVPS